jgi:hypothetical protein
MSVASMASIAAGSVMGSANALALLARGLDRPPAIDGGPAYGIEQTFYNGDGPQSRDFGVDDRCA